MLSRQFICNQTSYDHNFRYACVNRLSITSANYVSDFKVLIKIKIKDKTFSVNKACQESADVNGIKSRHCLKGMVS